MKKNYRREYLKFWLDYLKGKNEIDTKALALFLEKKLKGSYSPPTLKRYNSTVLSNLFGNGYVEGKKGKTFVGAVLPIVKTITLPVLDKCLTRDFGKVQITESELAAEAEAPTPKETVKKPRSTRKATVEKKAAKKARGRKTVPAKKKIVKKAVKKAGVQLPVRPSKKSDLLAMGQSSFLYVQQLNQQVAELERQVADYERIFQNLRQLFGREMDEMEEWILKVLQLS
jgi:hypothetical protein